MIRGDRVNLRSAPSASASVVDVLAGEMPLYPERSLPDWTLVRTPDGRVGWVHRTLLEVRWAKPAPADRGSRRWERVSPALRRARK